MLHSCVLFRESVRVADEIIALSEGLSSCLFSGRNIVYILILDREKMASSLCQGCASLISHVASHSGSSLKIHSDISPIIMLNSLLVCFSQMRLFWSIEVYMNIVLWWFIVAPLNAHSGEVEPGDMKPFFQPGWSLWHVPIYILTFEMCFMSMLALAFVSHCPEQPQSEYIWISDIQPADRVKGGVFKQ